MSEHTDQQSTGQPATPTLCPTCGTEVAATDSFCEACGSELTPTEVAAAPDLSDAPITLSTSTHKGTRRPTPDEAAVPPCLSCGGVVGADGYCETCGTLAPKPRDHYTEQPSSWVAAVCDRGVRHHRNEDAAAVSSLPKQGSRAVLVVCDGVSTSTDSDVASLAAARRAREVLESHQPAGMGTAASREAALSHALESAVAEANDAVIANSEADNENTSSCTFVGVVVEGDLFVYGNVGDSRAYWIPDPGGSEEPQELTVDDSVAQVRIAAGVPREEAENGPQAHAITKWLGRDSTDFVPRTGAVTVASDGWLLVCSDGLWNYASEATQLQQLINTDLADHTEPLDLAKAMVTWACEQGGKDNVTVALARRSTPVSSDVPADAAY